MTDWYMESLKLRTERDSALKRVAEMETMLLLLFHYLGVYTRDGGRTVCRRGRTRKKLLPLPKPPEVK